MPGSFAGGAGSGADGATRTHWPGCVMEMGSSIKEVGMVVDVDSVVGHRAAVQVAAVQRCRASDREMGTAGVWVVGCCG